MSESTAIVLQTEHAIMPAMDINMSMARYSMMKEFVSSCLVDGQDYGKVPGTAKDTLLKPGAEKLMSMFGLTPSFEAVEVVQDWTGKEHGEPFIYYWFKCKLHRGDTLAGEGEGSCNSWETKYRWRWLPESELGGMSTEGLLVKDSSISEWKFAVDKAETSGKYGKPQEYWNMFIEAERQGTLQMDQHIAPWNNKSTTKYTIPSRSYRVPNPDAAGVANTILKMAQKRALVAATLITTNASDFFTQDLEDMDISEVSYTVVAPQPTVQQKASAPPAQKPEVAEENGLPVTPSVRPAQTRQPMQDVQDVQEVDEVPFALVEGQTELVEPPIAPPQPASADLQPFIDLGMGRTDYEFSESVGNLLFDMRGRDNESELTLSVKAYGFMTGLVTKAIGITGRSKEWKTHGPHLWATIWSREINKDNTPGENVSDLIDWLNPDSDKYSEQTEADIKQLWDAVKAYHEEVSLWEPTNGVTV